MGQFIDITGRRQGNLLVLKSLQETNISGSRYWLCKCDCGKEFRASTSSINYGQYSCGCVQRKKFVQSHIGKPSSNLKPKGQSSSKIVQQSYKDNSKKRGLVYSLTYEQFIHLTSQNCYYCGAEPKQSMKAKSKYGNCNGLYYYNGLDRVDNNIGYVIDNVVPCCKHCNRAKFKMSKDEFLSWVGRIYNNMGL